MAAAAVVSVSMGVMKPVLAKLTTLMGDEYKKIKGLRKKVTFLQRELSDMDALLEKMDSADELDPQAKKWRSDIIEMSYNIEDCIDDFMHTVGEADGKIGILQKAAKYLRTFNDRRRLANDLQEIKTQVMEASERRKRYMLDQCISVTAPVVVDPRVLAIYKDSASLVGISAQKDKLVNWATDEGSQLKFMAIIGFGGIGKTTLANEVYHEVEGKFDCKAFVCASQKPGFLGLFNSLLGQLGLRPYSHACQDQDPINHIRAHLKDKRYFIVVDDLWDIHTLNTISCAFPQNNQNCRVVITTRIEDVAKSCCANHGFIHTMKVLSEADSRKLFFDRIFGPGNSCPSELTKASRDILKKCGGIPLAIITMASMLACQPKRLEEQWDSIKNSLATKFVINSNYEDMMNILDLSYKNLPRHLKACFLYLGSYPEDHLISRVELVRRWVAEGFVSNYVGQDIWDVADSYFNELVNRCMIQPIYRKDFNKVGGCRVHDMLLELIVRRCKEDNFLRLVNEPQVVLEVQDSKVIRRLTVVGLKGNKHGEEAITTTGNLSQIRSLTTLYGPNWMPPLLEFTFLRVLFLTIPYKHERAMDLTGINQLSQLRYVKIEGDVVLSSQIHGLRLLETLDLRLCNNKDNKSTQLEIVDTPRLSHLVMMRGTRLSNCIGKLTSLHTLCGFSLSMDSMGSITGLGELNSLTELELYLPVGCALLPKTSFFAALGTSLEKLDSLKELSVMKPLRFNDWTAWCADALSSISPPFRNLEKLDMSGCTFSRVPEWIGYLHNLRRLWLGAKQVLQEDIDMIGTRLPSLVGLFLRIPNIIPTGRIVIGGATGFPIVKWFEFDCDEISYLTFEAGAMPKLQDLDLAFDAQQWDKAAPRGMQHLPSLQKIRLHRTCYYDYIDVNSVACSFRININAIEENEAASPELIRAVFQEAIDALPVPATPPEITIITSGRRRPTEEEQWFERVQVQPEPATSPSP